MSSHMRKGIPIFGWFVVVVLQEFCILGVGLEVIVLGLDLDTLVSLGFFWVCVLKEFVGGIVASKVVGSARVAFHEFLYAFSWALVDSGVDEAHAY